MHRVTQYSTEELEYSMNWSPVVGCPTGATLLSTSWQAVGATGMSFRSLGTQEEYFSTVVVAGIPGVTEGQVYVLRNDAVVDLDGEQQTVEDRLEVYFVG